MWKPQPPSPYRLCQTLLSQTSHQQRSYHQTLPRQDEHSVSIPPRTSFDDFLPTDLGAYWDTKPPNEQQLKSAASFFAHTRHSPVKLYSAAQFRTIPFDSKEPEVAFLGKTNVGKSSLINALVDHEICRSGDKRGKTTEMNAYGIGGTKGGASKIVLLDMPGYGKGSKLQQGEEIMKYLQKRKQCA
jgi:GTP-binding protein